MNNIDKMVEDCKEANLSKVNRGLYSFDMGYQNFLGFMTALECFNIVSSKDAHAILEDFCKSVL